ncbi:UNVERIFIED_CONTAM: hypothetical protein Scaly_0063200 [Sesamum calycinum]|uniref:Uncharacterized protein n=1 Tax=Sesamum calycinum TaxID=2727403 RepID=A0AAW2SUQ0_9LAMI
MEYGYDTNRCRKLGLEIERLVQAGYLKDYMDKENMHDRKKNTLTTTAPVGQNVDVFAWSACDLVGIDPSVVVHRLNLNPTFPPVKQKKRYFGLEKDKVIQEEGYHEIMLNPKDQKCYKPKLSGLHISNTTGVKYEREMKPHVNLNEVRRLAGRIAALSRFISRVTEHDLPFFKALRKQKTSLGMRHANKLSKI